MNSDNFYFQTRSVSLWGRSLFARLRETPPKLVP